MKKIIYNAFFLAILFHNGLHGSSDQWRENESIWSGITGAVIFHRKFPQTLNYDSHKDKIDKIINQYIIDLPNGKVPAFSGKSNKHIRDGKALDVTELFLVEKILVHLKRYALSLEQHHQQTKKSEPTEAELAQAAQELVKKTQAADKAMQELLEEEAQKRLIAGQERSIAGDAKKNKGKSKKTKTNK